ncbi:MAG: hypothetical protein ABEJ31_12725 [Haloarculaceae archaeon]
MIQFVPLNHVATTVTALKTITLLLGALITYYAFKAYRRTRARPLGLLALGFAIVTLGSLIAGAVDVWLPMFESGVNRMYAIVVESALTAVGFAIIVYSLHTR